MRGAAAADPERLLTRPFVLASAANFLQGMAIHSYLHLPGFLRALGANELEIGFLFGLMAFAAISCRPVLGRVMDVRGRLIVIRVGSVLQIAICCLYLTVDSLGPWLVFVRVAQGVAEATLFASLFTYAADIVPPSRRTEGLALFGVSGLIPMSLGGLLGDLVLSRTGDPIGSYHALFALTAAFALAGLLCALPLREPPVAPLVGPRRSFFAALVQRDLMPLWFIGGSFATALAAVFTFVKTFVIEHHVGTVGLFFTAYSIAAVLLRLLLSWVPERIGPKRALYPAVGSLALGLLLLSRATGPVSLAVAGVLAGLGHGFTFPILSGLVVNRARDAERGAAMSLFTAVFDLGVLVGGPTLGAAIHLWGYAWMYTLAAGIVLTGAAVFALWDRAPREARA